MLYIHLFINEKKHCDIGVQTINYNNKIINYDFSEFKLKSIYFDVKITCVEFNKILVNSIFENFGYFKVMEKNMRLSTKFYFSKLINYSSYIEETPDIFDEFRKLITALYSHGLKRDKILINNDKVIEFIMY